MKSLVWITVKKTIRVLGASFGLLLFTLPLFSQANQGTIQGGVFDQTGGAMARAAGGEALLAGSGERCPGDSVEDPQFSPFSGG